MDLSVLHPVHSPERNYKWKDRLNGLTGHLDCRLLEWSGWYNQDIRQRLLGHYRLYQLFKAENSLDIFSLPAAYIVSYRASHGVKYALSSITSALYYFFTFGKRYSALQIEGINRVLVNDKAMILQEFLQDSENNFTSALNQAIGQIESATLFNKAENKIMLIQQNKYDYNHYNTTSHYFNEYTTVQASVNGIKGKEKGVFSKKQLLIFFDLLAESKSIDKIDYTKPNKFESIALMLQAISGKSKDSIMEQLKDARNDGLYSFQNQGELNQLIITLTNLAETFRKAGFRSVAAIADKKIRELERLR